MAVGSSPAVPKSTFKMWLSFTGCENCGFYLLYCFCNPDGKQAKRKKKKQIVVIFSTILGDRR